MSESYQKLLSFVRKLSLPNKTEDYIKHKLSLTELEGDDAEEIFVNGTDYMEADIAVRARDILRGME